MKYYKRFNTLKELNSSIFLKKESEDQDQDILDLCSYGNDLNVFDNMVCANARTALNSLPDITKYEEFRIKFSEDTNYVAFYVYYSDNCEIVTIEQFDWIMSELGNFVEKVSPYEYIFYVDDMSESDIESIYGVTFVPLNASWDITDSEPSSNDTVYMTEGSYEFGQNDINIEGFTAEGEEAYERIGEIDEQLLPIGGIYTIRGTEDTIGLMCGDTEEKILLFSNRHTQNQKYIYDILDDNVYKFNKYVFDEYDLPIRPIPFIDINTEEPSITVPDFRVSWDGKVTISVGKDKVFAKDSWYNIYEDAMNNLPVYWRYTDTEIPMNGNLKAPSFKKVNDYNGHTDYCLQFPEGTKFVIPFASTIFGDYEDVYTERIPYFSGKTTNYSDNLIKIEELDGFSHVIYSEGFDVYVTIEKQGDYLYKVNLDIEIDGYGVSIDEIIEYVRGFIALIPITEATAELLEVSNAKFIGAAVAEDEYTNQLRPDLVLPFIAYCKEDDSVRYIYKENYEEEQSSKSIELWVVGNTGDLSLVDADGTPVIGPTDYDYNYYKITITPAQINSIVDADFDVNGIYVFADWENNDEEAPIWECNSDNFNIEDLKAALLSLSNYDTIGGIYMEILQD